MDISIKFIRDMGFKKIEEYYSKALDFDSIQIKSYLFDTDKMSAFSVANNWSSTFGMVRLADTPKFEEWYKLYYPMVGLIKNTIDQTRVLKASQKLRVDYLEATKRDLQELLIYTPKLELEHIKSEKPLKKEEVMLCRFINIIYAWSILIYSLQKNSIRERFEITLELLIKDYKLFEESLKEF